MRLNIKVKGDISDGRARSILLKNIKDHLVSNLPDRLTATLANKTRGKWSYTDGIFADPRYIKSGYVNLSEYWNVEEKPNAKEDVVSFYIINDQPYFDIEADPERIRNERTMGNPPTFPAGNEAHYLYRGSTLPRAPNPNIYPVAQMLMFYVNGKKEMRKSMPPRNPSRKFIDTVEGSVNKSISEVMQYGRL